MKRVIIDTDPGIDDAAAILMALGSPEIQIDAITTIFGNTPVENCTTNTLRILEAANRTDIPVYLGCEQAVQLHSASVRVAYPRKRRLRRHRLTAA